MSHKFQTELFDAIASTTERCTGFVDRDRCVMFFFQQTVNLYVALFRKNQLKNNNFLTENTKKKRL